MKRVYGIIIGGLLCLSSFSQRVASLDVIGEAKKMVLPDKAIINLDISVVKNTELESFKNLNEISVLLLKRLKNEGFSDEQIKLNDFSISTTHDFKEKKPKYQVSQNLVVKFPLDKQRIFKIYSKLIKDSIQGVGIILQTECSDELSQKIQEELIVMAMKDAKRKASIIAAQSEYNILSVSNIGYKYYSDNNEQVGNSIRFVPPVIKPDEQADEEEEIVPNSTLYFSINEQEFSEQVKVTYLIEPKK